MRQLKSSGCKKVLMSWLPEKGPSHIWVVTQVLGLVQAAVGGSLPPKYNWTPGVRPGRLLVKIEADRNTYSFECSQNERIVCLVQQLSVWSNTITSFAEKSTVKVGLKIQAKQNTTINQSNAKYFNIRVPEDRNNRTGQNMFKEMVVK